LQSTVANAAGFLTNDGAGNLSYGDGKLSNVVKSFQSAAGVNHYPSAALTGVQTTLSGVTYTVSSSTNAYTGNGFNNWKAYDKSTGNGWHTNQNSPTNETKITSFTLTGNILIVSYINSKFVEDWIAVYKVGTWPNTATGGLNSMVYKYTGATGNGTIQLNMGTLSATAPVGSAFTVGQQYYMVFSRNDKYFEYPDDIENIGQGQGNNEPSRTNVFTYGTNVP